MSEKPAMGPVPFDFFSWMNQFARPMLEASSGMAQPLSAEAQLDPLAALREMQQRNEQALTHFMAKLVGTPEFSANLGQQATGTAIAHETLRKSTQAYLEAASMPTREDITRVAALVVGLDAKLDDLQEKMEEAEAAQQHSKPAPLLDLGPRLDELNAKLDRLLTMESRLSQLEDRLAVPANPTPRPTAPNAKSPRKPSPKATAKPTETQEDK